MKPFLLANAEQLENENYCIFSPLSPYVHMYLLLMYYIYKQYEMLQG